MNQSVDSIDMRCCLLKGSAVYFHHVRGKRSSLVFQNDRKPEC